MTTEMIALEGTTKIKIADIKNPDDKHIIQRCLATIYPPDRNVMSKEAYQPSVYIIVDKETNELLDGSMGIEACKHFTPQNDSCPVWLVDRKEVDEIQARFVKEYNFDLNNEADDGMSRAAALIETVEGKPFLDFISYMKQYIRFKKDNGNTKITSEEIQFLAKFYENAIDNSDMHIWIIDGEGEGRDNHIYNNNCHCKTILRESIKEFVTTSDNGNMFDIVKANLLKYDLKDLADRHFCLVCPVELNKILPPEIEEVHYLISRSITYDEISDTTTVIGDDRAKLKEAVNKMSEEDRIKFQQFQKNRTTNIRISKQDGKVTELTAQETEEAFKEVWHNMSPEQRDSLVARIMPEEKEYQLKSVFVREIKQKHDSMTFDYFFDNTDERIKSYLLENQNIATSLYLYTKSDQTVTTFFMSTESDNPARDIPKAVHTIMKSHWHDYFIIATECWLKPYERSEEDRDYKLGDVTNLPRNEKKECLIFKGGSKQDGLKEAIYEIIREDPEDDSSKILRFEKLDSHRIDDGIEK